MMSEKIAVAVVVDAEIAEKINMEVKREALRDELAAILNRIEQEGFKLAISDKPDKTVAAFDSNIIINSKYFNYRDRHATYIDIR